MDKDKTLKKPVTTQQAFEMRMMRCEGKGLKEIAE
ncbi:unnamed protein product, partial [marine sediment metagenome]